MSLRRALLGLRIRRLVQLGHVYTESSSLSEARFEEKLAVTRASGARHSSIRFGHLPYTKLILRITGQRPGFKRQVTDEDIQSLVREAERSGVLREIERELVEGVLDLEERAVRTIMEPRPDVAWVNLDESKDAIVEWAGRARRSQVL
jgi:hypothetical protein